MHRVSLPPTALAARDVGAVELHHEQARRDDWPAFRSLLDQLTVAWEVRAGRREIDLLFVGDSLTELWLHPAGGRRSFAKTFASWRPAAFGVGGDRCAHVRWRLAHGVVDGLRPGATVLCIGANQLARRYPAHRTIDEILGTAADLLERMPRTRLLLSSVLPQDPGWEWDPRPKIDEINAGLRASRLPRTTFVDVTGTFADGRTLRRHLYSDGVHLSRAGYRAWAAVLRPAIEPVLGRADAATLRRPRLPGPGPLTLRLRELRGAAGLAPTVGRVGPVRSE